MKQCGSGKFLLVLGLLLASLLHLEASGQLGTTSNLGATSNTISKVVLRYPPERFFNIFKSAGKVSDKHVFVLGRGITKGLPEDKLLMKKTLEEVQKLPLKTQAGTYLRGLAEAGQISAKEADDIFYRLQNVPKLAERLKLFYGSAENFRHGYLWEVRTAAGFERLGVKVLDMSKPYHLTKAFAGETKGDVDLLIKLKGRKYLVECKSYTMETLDKLGGREKILTQIDKYKSAAPELGAEQTIIVCLQGKIDELTLRAVRQKNAIITVCEKNPESFEVLDKMLRQVLVQLP
jgi:hypothetical protein